ncbi:hypothetical protein [Kroppenstedtia sanguinis]|uniref:Type II toxin-antitoxin system HicB family antitoxin n=1 Tax=Kroppenstedtia sanguinis TaxID=1380684 RepID=A0ABW4C6Y5_9BACL
MKKQYSYPCVFEQARNNVSFYFPDFPAVGTHENIEKGVPVARGLLRESILQYKDRNQPLPPPSNPKDIKLYDSSDQIVFISIEEVL